MLLSAAAQNDISPLLMIEGSGTMIAFAAAFAWPRLGSSWFSCLERAFARLARRRGLAVAAVGLATLLLRLAMLPLCPIPLPFVPDDFSNLLASDTFAHGRLTNPTPALWTHFESIHITMQPTYMSMYFPAQGLLLAAGKVLLGQPWYAVLISSALMAAGICWMLQAWLPPGWALLGGILAMLRLGLFSYWVNTYTGGGLILALGGALVLGALPRLMKTARFRYGLLMAVGIVLLALTRPYEGLLLCLPVAFVLGRWVCFGRKRPASAVLLRRAAVPLALLIAALAWLGYYDYRAFGSPLTLPYTVNRAAYAMAPYFIWQSPRPEPHYRHPEMRRFYYESELKIYTKVRSRALFIPFTLVKVWTATVFFTGFALLPPLIMLHRVLLDRRTRFLVLCVLVLMAGMLIMIYMIPHYLAPFTAAFYAIGLQCMRHLRVWKPEGRPAGAALVRLCVLLCFVLAGLRVFAAPLHFTIPEWPPNNWSSLWYGPERYGTDRAHIQDELEHLPGKQLVVVRSSPKRNVLDQWVYNQADIPAAKVIWAQEMDAANNRELINYYRDRKAWLVQMDTEPATLTPYPVPALPAAARH
ncbi:MAG: hypothetical protein P4K94_05650 [Terracidiphilus sp.]|nr:hypothetical protein [Terracidiphilus sp.]